MSKYYYFFRVKNFNLTVYLRVNNPIGAHFPFDFFFDTVSIANNVFIDDK
jgi:hypothetical protein